MLKFGVVSVGKSASAQAGWAGSIPELTEEPGAVYGHVSGTPVNLCAYPPNTHRRTHIKTVKLDLSVITKTSEVKTMAKSTEGFSLLVKGLTSSRLHVKAFISQYSMRFSERGLCL